jgi:hypothetical protein
MKLTAMDVKVASHPIKSGRADVNWRDIPAPIRNVINTNSNYSLLTYNPRSRYSQNYHLSWDYYSDGYLDLAVSKDVVGDEGQITSQGISAHLNEDYQTPPVWAEVRESFESWLQQREGSS